MERKDNYVIQANQAKRRFLTYDQERLVRKLKARSDEQYIYVSFLSEPYRLERTTGDVQRWDGSAWVDGNSFAEVMTLLDMMCDSREDRCLSGRWKSMTDFGLMFHQNLLEERKDAAADIFDRDPEGFRRACIAMEGLPIPGADIGYAIPLFDGLRIGVQFWHGDDEFYPRLRYLWDENALQYIRYETMHYVLPLMLKRIKDKMK